MESKKHAPRLPTTTSRRGAGAVVWLAGMLVALCFFTLPLFLAASRARPGLSDVRQMGIRSAATARHASRRAESPPASQEARDVLLGGLLSPDISESSCLSRYRSALHRPASSSSSHSPSPYLTSRLRKYEALHRKCGPGTLFYKKSLMQLTAANSMGLAACNYLVWTPCNHLGDRMLSMASAFLYALLTHRVFLVHLTDDMADLFCEPFPDASWELPAGFLVDNLTLLHRGTAQSYGNLVGAKKVIRNSGGVRGESLPAYAYIHLQHDYQQPDQLFFCDGDQTVLGKVNWLVLSSDLYFAPGLFLVPQFEDELRWMFPARDTVFHHLGRYLFHPSNRTWKLVTRYYKSYMAAASFQQKIGVQITTFPWSPVPSPEYFKQVMACATQAKILPELVVDPDAAAATTTSSSTKAVLVSSAQPEYAEKMKAMFYEHATVTGETVSVLQPAGGSGGKQSENQKVLAEILLQSYCDVSVVSGWSTVGYISHSLAGVKPWLLLTPRNQTAADPPCVRTTSMEPCFHAPPSYDCRAKKNGDLGAVLRHVRHCEDAGDGIKLYD